MKRNNPVLRLAWLNVLMVKPYAKTMLLMLAMGVGFGVFMRTSTMVNAYLMTACLTASTYPFMAGEKGNADVLHATLPVRRRDVVLGRYAMVLLIGVLVLGLNALLTYALSPLMQGGVSLSTSLMTAALMLIIYLVVVSFQYPIYFKVGYLKGRTLSYAPLLVLFLVVVLWPMIVKWLGIDVAFEVKRLAALLLSLPGLLGILAAVIAIVSLSVYLSCRFYQRRDL